MAKQAIDEGQIGQIVSMHARRNLSVKIGRMVLDSISALMGDGIHDGDLMLWFSQARPVSVYAQEIHPGSNKYPDGGWAMARLDNGAIAVIESIWHLPESTPYQIDARMEVIGTQGRLYINCGEAGLEIHDAAGNRRPDTLYWPNVFGQRFGILRAELRYFADCVAAGRRPDRITPAGVARRRGPAGRRRRVVAVRTSRSLLTGAGVIMQFDHVGIITTEKHDDEIYVPATKVWVTDFRKNPFHIEWLRFEPDTPVTGPVRQCRTWPFASTVSARPPRG